MALGYLEVTRSAPSVPLRVANLGDASAPNVNAVIQLPAGLQFAPPGGGSGGLSRMSDRLHAFMTFSATNSVEIDHWTCTINDALDTANCLIDAVEPGEVVASLAVNVTVGSGQALAENATTSYSVTAGGETVSYAVPTGLKDQSENFTDTFTGSGQLAATHFGAPLMGCAPGSSVDGQTCENVMAFSGNGALGRLDNNAWQMVPLNEAGGERNSATTSVTLPEGAVVKYAAVEWAANRTPFDSAFDGQLNQARIRVPGGEYVDLSADSTVTSYDNENRLYYQSRADITELVAAAGAGDYSLADIALAATRNMTVNGNYFGGFALTVVYEHPDLPQSHVAFFEGSDWVTTSNHPDFVFFTDKPAKITLGFVAWDGDRGSVNDRVDVGTGTGGGTTLTPFGWNGSNVTSAGDSGNAASSTAFGSRWSNTLGTDAKLFKALGVGAGKHVITMRGGDNYLMGTFTVTIVAD